MNVYDYFSGRGSSALGAPASDPRVAQAQQTLNTKGYGPVTVDGILGAETRAAIGRALGVSVDAVTDEVLKRLENAPVITTEARPGSAINSGVVPQPPLWKQPLFIGVGVAALLGVAFFFLKNETKVFSGASEGAAERHRGEWGRHAKPVRTTRTRSLSAGSSTIEGKVTRKRCTKTPDWDAQGEPA